MAWNRKTSVNRVSGKGLPALPHDSVCNENPPVVVKVVGGVATDPFGRGVELAVMAVVDSLLFATKPLIVFFCSHVAHRLISILDLLSGNFSIAGPLQTFFFGLDRTLADIGDNAVG